MPSSNIVWPTPGEYDSALQNRRTTFTDPDIQQGLLHEIAGRPARLNGGGSKYVCVYRVGNWVVRCFTSDPPNAPPPADMQLRYRIITAYFSRLRSSPELSFLVPHIWVERGISVGADIFPFLKVPFILGAQPLGDFLIDHHTDSHAMNLLAHRWFDLVEQLEARQIAHGDLDMTNVLICGTLPNLSLKLIDFDGMYVPDLAPYNLGVADAGHEHFQPAQPGIRTFGSQLDRFSVLIIYLTLSALTTNPALWENCDADETRPLLKREDFDRLGLSKNFIRLLQERNNKDLQKCLQELQDSVMQHRMPRSLAEILNRSGTLYAVKETPLYGGRSLVIPVDKGSGPTPTPIPPPPPPPRTAPIQPTQPAQLTQPIGPAQSPVTTKPTSRRQIVIATVVIVLVLAALLIWFLIYQASHHASRSAPSPILYQGPGVLQALQFTPGGDYDA